MFAQFVLVTLILPALSDFTIHQESYQRDCIDLTCPKGAFKEISHPLVKDDSKEAQCTICSQCTDFGFSVCAQSRPNSLRFKRDIDNHLCTCANSVPAGCKITQRSAKKDPNTEIFNVCYLSTLRTPPKPLALNQQKEVIATLEPFWLEPYWKEFGLSQLTLFFEFEVKSPELCDEIGNVTTNEGADPPHVCTSSLHMEMTGQDIPDGTAKKAYDPTDFFSQTDDIEYDGEEEDDAPPEVEFARNVFAGAKHVKLWYTVVVKRSRQLNLLKGEQPFQDVTTVLSSENLKFNLQPEVYGDGNGNISSDSAADVLDDDVTSGNETSSFFEEHFGSWPLVRVGIVLTLVACVLIIAAACCYRYRGCCCYSDQQKLTTKTSNGYEYHVTGQTGQEMVGPPETEKLTH
ncbi:hypothetical protein FO519_003608 [Halicephalobus sp. NKZ332]|nr:hypothetical protein FO519_003608 [Halicephalobus sp. NKZ332]